MLLGPAYKGIPLVTATSIALSEEHNINVPIAYNRKEHKTHGEGGVLVGSTLIGRVLVVDDVITAGTAIRETLRLIFDAKADLAGAVVGIDREERGIGDTSAVQEIEKDFKTNVLSMVGLGDLVNYLENTETNDKKYLLEMQGYRARYGVNKNP
jgi:orotate phosphoribosyltransferase